MVTGRMSWRRFGSLVYGLVGETALSRAIEADPSFEPDEPDEDALWGLEHHLLAAVVDHLAVANWQRGSGKPGSRPKPFPRPGLNDESTQRYGGRRRSPLTDEQKAHVLAALAPPPKEV